MKIRLPHQSFQILVWLLERPGEVVTRKELQQKLWPANTFVDFDMGLSSAVKKLRDAFGDSAENPRLVETVPRHGYRFIGPVDGIREVAAGHAPAARLRAWRAAAAGTIALIAVLAVVFGLNIGHLRDRLLNWLEPPKVRSIAVLPLENLTGDPAQEYVVDAMTDALTTELARARILEVISRTSATQYKGARQSLRKVAKELNVDAVVEGTVSRSGERMQINAQLIHASSDRHLWAQRYDRDLREIAGLPSEIAWDIMRALPANFRPGEQPRQDRPRPMNADAYEAYIKGRFFWNKREPENLLKALKYYQQAIEADPSYAPAYSGLSDAYRLGTLNGLASGREFMPKAEAAARKALKLDDTLAEAHNSLAGVLYRYRWDWTGAEKEFQRALELDPNYEEAHRSYGIYLLTLNRNEEGLTHLQRARQLSPLSPAINTDLATALVRVGRFDEAIEQLKKTQEIDSNFGRLPLTLASAYAGKGDSGQALAVLEQSVAQSRGRAAPWLGYAYAVTGRRREAEAVLAALEERSKKRYVSPQAFAIVHIGLGNKAKALGLLEKAYEERSLDLLGLTAEQFDPLRSDPRFQDLLRRIGLAR